MYKKIFIIFFPKESSHVSFVSDYGICDLKDRKVVSHTYATLLYFANFTVCSGEKNGHVRKLWKTNVTR